MSSPFKPNLLRRTATVLAAAAAFLVAGQVSALTVTMTNNGAVPTCNNASMNVTPDGSVTIACGSGGSTAPTFNLSNSTYSLATGLSTSSTVLVNRGGSLIDAINVPYTMTGGCSPTAGNVSFSAGISSPQAIPVATPSSAGSCVITLGTPSAGSLGNPSAATVTVVNADADVSFAFSAAASGVSIPGTASSITVQRSGGTNGVWSVPYTIGGTATAAAVTGTLNFPASSSTATLTVTPPASVPSGVTLPTTLTVNLGTPTKTSGAPAQNGSIGGTGVHTITVTEGSDCQASGPVIDSTLGGAGNYLMHTMPSGSVLSIPVPAPPSSNPAGQFTFTGLPALSSPQTVIFEITISKCRGRIDPNAAPFCYVKTVNNASYNAIKYLYNITAKFFDVASAGTRSYCFSPASQGQYYMNTRWTYSQCEYGSPSCGFTIQYN